VSGEQSSISGGPPLEDELPLLLADAVVAAELLLADAVVAAELLLADAPPMPPLADELLEDTVVAAELLLADAPPMPPVEDEALVLVVVLKPPPPPEPPLTVSQPEARTVKIAAVKMRGLRRVCVMRGAPSTPRAESCRLRLRGFRRASPRSDDQGVDRWIYLVPGGGRGSEGALAEIRAA
jgi:hypothetical protein